MWIVVPDLGVYLATVALATQRPNRSEAALRSAAYHITEHSIDLVQEITECEIAAAGSELSSTPIETLSARTMCH
eukprot:2638794-Rhodomonas_salina.1